MNKLLQILTFLGRLRDGGRDVYQNCRVILEIYDDELYYIAEQDIEGDGTYDKLLQEFMVPYCLVQSIEEEELGSINYDPFQCVWVDCYEDLRKQHNVARRIEIPQSGNGVPFDVERRQEVRKLLELLWQNYQKDKKAEDLASFLESKRKFFTEAYQMTPEETLAWSQKNRLRCIRGNELIEVGVLEKRLHIREGDLYHYIDIPGAIPSAYDFDCIDNFIDCRLIAYVLGFKNYRELAEFIEKEKGVKPIEEFEVVPEGDFSLVEADIPLLVVYFFAGRYDCLTLVQDTQDIFTLDTFGYRCMQQWTYEAFIERTHRKKNKIDPNRLNRHNFRAKR